MPSIATRRTIFFPSNEDTLAVNPTGRSDGDATPRKRRLRSNATAETDFPERKSPRHSSPAASPLKGAREGVDETTGELSVERSLRDLIGKENWNPRDMEHVRSAKEAMHVSTMPFNVVCRKEEQKRVLDFCKECVEQEKPGSLFVCGCPGTGKSLLMGKVKQHLVDWAKEMGWAEVVDLESDEEIPFSSSPSRRKVHAFDVQTSSPSFPADVANPWTLRK